MKRQIYLLFAALMCTFMACQKEVIDVRDFGKVRIDSISPITGPAGTYVVVHGYNFTHRAADAKVLINNAEVRIVTMAMDSMILQIPETAMSGELVFNFNRKNPTGGWDYSDQVDSAFTGPIFKVDANVIPVPLMQAVLPMNGKAGAVITIDGYNFIAGSCKVFFGETEGTITENTGTQIKVKVPKIDPGVVALRMEQGSHVVQMGAFTVDETPKGVKEIYWSGYNTVYKAVMDEDGNPVISTIIDNSHNIDVNVTGVTVDQQRGRVYFMTIFKIFAANIDGSGTPEMIYSGPEANMLQDIALDSQGRIYATAYDAAWTGKNHIIRVNADGTGLEEIYPLGQAAPGALKVDEATGKIYWIDIMNQIVYEGSMNGETAQQPKKLFDASNGVAGPATIALDATHIYISEGTTGSCMVGNRDGSGTPVQLPIPSTMISGASDLEIDPDNGYLYWVTYDFMVGKSTLWRAKTDGTGVQRVMENMPEAYNFYITF